jgi:hypothetical protein
VSQRRGRGENKTKKEGKAVLAAISNFGMDLRQSMASTLHEACNREAKLILDTPKRLASDSNKKYSHQNLPTLCHCLVYALVALCGTIESRGMRLMLYFKIIRKRVSKRDTKAFVTERHFHIVASDNSLPVKKRIRFSVGPSGTSTT